jgi:hypothetical protein
MPDLGIGELLAGSLLADAVGTTAATGIVDAGIGAGLGAVEGGITGGNVGLDALAGGVTGGAVGVGPGISAALDVSPTIGTALTGAAGGAAGSAVTGSNPLIGAAEGGIGGAISGASAGAGTPQTGTTGSTTPSGVTPVSGGIAAVPAAPAGVSGGGDVTLPDQFPTPGGPQSTNFAPSGTGSSFSTPDSALSGSTGANLTTSGGGGNEGFSFSGSNTPSTTSANTNFLNGSPPTSGSAGGAPNIGQGPTPANAANLSPAGGANAPNSLVTAFNDPSFSNIGKALSSNAGLLTAGAGLTNDISTALAGPPKGTNQLTAQAGQLGAQGQQLEGYLGSGTLPPGVQSGINQATQSAIAAIKSKYASMGLSGSSSEQSDIAAAETNAQVQGANIAMQLLNQGVSETNLSSQIYEELIKNTMASDANFSSAFTNLASAVGGGSGGGGTTIRIGGG